MIEWRLKNFVSFFKVYPLYNPESCDMELHTIEPYDSRNLDYFDIPEVLDPKSNNNNNANGRRCKERRRRGKEGSVRNF